MTTTLHPDYTDPQSGSMCWDIGSDIKLWRSPDGAWLLVVSNIESIPANVGLALALGYQGRAEVEQDKEQD